LLVLPEMFDCASLFSAVKEVFDLFPDRILLTVVIVSGECNLRSHYIEYAGFFVTVLPIKPDPIDDSVDVSIASLLNS
jgi:hypothetical protein